MNIAYHHFQEIYNGLRAILQLYEVQNRTSAHLEIDFKSKEAIRGKNQLD